MKRIGIVISALALSLSFYGCKKKQINTPPAPAVTVVAAVKGNIISSTEIIGQCKANYDVNLVARVKGFLTKQNFREGSYVKKNQVLFEIQKDEYEAKVQACEAQLERTKAKQMNANIEFDRQKKLLSENATSRRNYDDALANKMSADADVLDAQASLTQSQINLGYTTIPAPFNGRIGIATYSVGNVVGPESKYLANIVSMDPMRVEFNVDEMVLLKMNEKSEDNPRFINTILVKLKFQDNSIYDQDGEISYSSNKVNTSTGTILVEAIFPNKKNVLVPGMYVKVMIIDRKKIPALLIPVGAVLQDQAGDYVLLVNKEHKVEERRVKTGLTSGESIQITEGLKAGDYVITDGIQKVRKDMVVKPNVDTNYAVEQNNIEIITPKKQDDKKTVPQPAASEKKSGSPVKPSTAPATAKTSAPAVKK